MTSVTPSAYFIIFHMIIALLILSARKIWKIDFDKDTWEVPYDVWYVVPLVLIAFFWEVIALFAIAEVIKNIKNNTNKRSISK